jgi:hypothetical protein
MASAGTPVSRVTGAACCPPGQAGLPRAGGETAKSFDKGTLKSILHLLIRAQPAGMARRVGCSLRNSSVMRRAAMPGRAAPGHLSRWRDGSTGRRASGMIATAPPLASRTPHGRVALQRRLVAALLSYASFS